MARTGCCVEAAALCVALVLLSGCSGRSAKLLDEVNVLAGAAAAAPAHGRIGLRDCIARAASVGPAVSRAGIASLLERAEIDDISARGDLLARGTLSYGRTVVGEGEGFNLSQSIQWDAIRFFQLREVESYRSRAEDSGERMRNLARKRAALDTAQAFFEYALALEREALAGQVLESRRRELALISPEPHLSGRAAALAEEASVLERRRLAAAGTAAQRRLLLDRIANLSSEAKIVPEIPAPPSGGMEPLEAYLGAALQKTPLPARAKLRREVAEKVAAITATSRWTDFAADLTFLDLFDTAATPLTAPLRWTVAVLDGGRHEREVLRARAEALLAGLDAGEAVHQAAVLATRAWFDLAEKRIAYALQRRRTDQARIALWTSEARRSAAPAEARQRQQELREQEVELLAQQQALLLSHMQFELLRRRDYDEWIEASLAFPAHP